LAADKANEQTSEAILGLKPVSFQYKSDSKGTRQFGLIAEEVAKVNPDLVVCDRTGQIYSVRYEAVNEMLLNEFLKEHRTVQELKKEVAALTAGYREHTTRIEQARTATVLNISRAGEAARSPLFEIARVLPKSRTLGKPCGFYRSLS
jgi:endosialidase-like protein